jgi:hypothetical protein
MSPRCSWCGKRHPWARHARACRGFTAYLASLAPSVPGPSIAGARTAAGISTHTRQAPTVDATPSRVGEPGTASEAA